MLETAYQLGLGVKMIASQWVLTYVSQIRIELPDLAGILKKYNQDN